MTCDKQTAAVSITILVREQFRTLVLIIHQGSGNTLTWNIFCPGGENGEWKASKWILTHTHSGWKRRGHQTGPYFKPLRIPAPPHVLLPQFCATVKTRIDDFSPKAVCYIISSVLCFCSFFCFSFLFFYSVLFHSEAIKPVTHEADRSRPSSVKCVGHFGSVRAGGTQSNCSLEGKCDRASLSPSTRRQMMAAKWRESRNGRKAGGRVKVKREEKWERGWHTVRERERAGGYH